MSEMSAIDAPVSDSSPPVCPPVSSRRWLIAALAWIALWSAGLFVTSNYLFERKADWSTGMYSNAARTLVNQGFASLRGGVYMLPGDFPSELRDFYPGHPPLLSWMLAGWMALFGQSDAAIGTLPLLFTALNLLLIYFLTARVLGPPAGLAATVICSLLPMTAFYAQSINMEWFTVTFMLGASLAYLRYVGCGCKWAAGLLLGCVIIGCWMDWPMHVFSGLLAVMHWLSLPQARPWKMSIALVGLPVLMFALFAIYLHLHGAGVMELIGHAKIRSGVTESGAVAAQGASGDASAYHTLFKMLGNRRELKKWFIDYFTYPALLLASAGAIAWRWWSPATARDESSRRTLFGLLTVFLLTQAIYTLVFVEGALRHEFWNYYLVVPISIFAGGLCVSLTALHMDSDQRRLATGALDRLAWALVLMVPLFAYGPLWAKLRGVPIDWSRIGYADDLRLHTNSRDAVFTDRRIGYSLSWYADRMVFYNRDFLNVESLQSWARKYSLPEHRVLYLWEDARSEEKNESLRELSKQLKADLITRFGQPYRAGGKLTFFVLHGPPNTDWKRQGPPASMPTTQP